MDVVEYQHLGNKGKSLRLVKYFENPPVDYDVTRVIPWSLPEDSGLPPADRQFTIRRFIPEDAMALAELAYDTYGYSYLYENIYFPDRTVAMNASNEIISVVAITDDGILAGHAGLFCNPAYPGIAELGMAMVKPEFRGYHLLDRMAVLCNSTALELGINGLFSQALTLHKRSQPSVKKAGMLPCGFLLGYFPSADIKGLDNLTKDRVTPVVNFKLLRPYHAGTLYPPERHLEIIGNLFSTLAVTWDKGEIYDSGRTDSVFSIQVNEVSSYARLFVYETGSDIILNLKSYLNRLRREGLMIGELMLNLGDPLTYKFYDEIEALGFIFTGILPATTRGNFITLVYLNGINANFDNIQLIEDYGQELLEYIRRDYEGRFLRG
jgi:serine/threonine-protein kinase RsbW